MKKSILIVLFLALIAGSCTYSDYDDYFETIESDYSPAISMFANFDTTGPVTIVDSVLFTYNISIDTGRLYAVNLFLGNTQFYASDTLKDSIWIDPYFIDFDGEYKLYMIAYFKSYSGSLADKLNAEFLYRENEWNINIQRFSEE